MVEEKEPISLEEQQNQNRLEIIKKVEAALQMKTRALRTRVMFATIFFLLLIAFTLDLTAQDFLTKAALVIIIIVTIWHLKHENDFIEHIKKTYGI